MHLRGTYLVTRAAWDVFLQQGTGGRVVNTSSTSGLIGNFGQANYGAAKSGIAGFTRVLALEGAKSGITVNTLAPAALSRMTEGIMPPGSYRAMHWNAPLGADEEETIVDWVRAERAAQPAPGVPEPLRSQLLRPIPDAIPHDPAKAALGERPYHDKASRATARSRARRATTSRRAERTTRPSRTASAARYHC